MCRNSQITVEICKNVSTSFEMSKYVFWFEGLLSFQPSHFEHVLSFLSVQDYPEPMVDHDEAVARNREETKLSRFNSCQRTLDVLISISFNIFLFFIFPLDSYLDSS